MAAALMFKFNGLAHRETHLILQRFGAAELILLGDLLGSKLRSTVKCPKCPLVPTKMSATGNVGTPFRIRHKPVRFSIWGMSL